MGVLEMMGNMYNQTYLTHYIYISNIYSIYILSYRYYII